MAQLHLSFYSPTTISFFFFPPPFLANISEWVHHPALGPRNAYGRTTVNCDLKRLSSAKNSGSVVQSIGSAVWHTQTCVLLLDFGQITQHPWAPSRDSESLSVLEKILVLGSASLSTTPSAPPHTCPPMRPPKFPPGVFVGRRTWTFPLVETWGSGPFIS